jgi:ATP-binding cassette subfamily F protein uup
MRGQAPTRPRKLTFKEQRELEGMEAAILATETRVHELETTLNDPEFHATRSREAHGLIADLEAAKAEVTRLYERWQELASVLRESSQSTSSR